MTTSSEDILRLVDGVRHKKNDGTLYLMAERIAWMPNGKDTFTISYKYADIKMQKISPEGKAKIQLQIVLHTNEATTFHFVSPLGIEKQLSDRNEVKELLQQLLPRFKQKISKELEEKNRILSDDPDLFKLYKDLVVSQVISADEFWTQLAPIRCPSLVKILNIPFPKVNFSSFNPTPANQIVGISPAFLADIKPQADGCNGIKYNITSEVIGAIFRTYPAVKRKHFENVPHKMSESEFWTRFFQSHYLHRDRVFSSSISKSDLFADCAKSDESEIRLAAKKGVADPFVDLTKFDDNEIYEKEDRDKNKDGESLGDYLPNANQALIKRFNLHSIMILEASKGKSGENDKQLSLISSLNGVIKDKKRKDKKSKEKDVEEIYTEPEIEEVRKIKKVRLEEKTCIDDLDSRMCTDLDSWINKEAKALRISDKRRYLEGPTPISGDQAHSLSLLQSFYIQENAISRWKLSLDGCLSSPAAITALSELSPGGVFLKSCQSVNLKDVIPQDVQNEIKQVYFSCNELLKHFWSCFPVTSESLEEKLAPMKATLERFQLTKVQPMHEKLIKDRYDSELTAHLLSQLQLAYNKFNSWQVKKGSLMRK